MIDIATHGWVKIGERFIRISAISGVQYNEDKFELRVYEINGYTHVSSTGPTEFQELAKILNIQEGSALVAMELGL